jgi:ppGpp synthetase/RelA/SpoT-type nucleotidyltranferase
MAWTVPKYSKNKVNWAGKMLIVPEPDDYDEYQEYVANYIEALEIVNNWRSAHNFPLNTFHIGLRRRAMRIDPSCVTAQRIKRLSSIEAKLQRFETMTLSQMQDIGGCRAILNSMPHVRQLCSSFFDSDIKHELAQEDNYVDKPKSSGYRGAHLIYRYFSDKKTNYNTLKIEIQLRTQTQHVWATAVETVGTFLQQALKSSQGETEWLRFFALMGSAFAHLEGTPLVPNTPTNYSDLINELRDKTKTLDVVARLRTYGQALHVLESPTSKDHHYFLISLDPSQGQVQVWGYRISDSEQATKDYLELEKKIKGTGDAVLVSVESVDALRRAYPNYFLDTNAFIEKVEKITRTLRKPKLPAV